MSIVSFRSIKSKLNIYSLADAMEKFGWQLERQRLPDSIHCSVMPQHASVKEIFIQNLIESIDLVLQDPSKFKNTGSAAIYGLIGKIPDEELIVDYMKFLLDELYQFPKI